MLSLAEDEGNNVPVELVCASFSIYSIEKFKKASSKVYSDFEKACKFPRFYSGKAFVANCNPVCPRLASHACLVPNPGAVVLLNLPACGINKSD